MSGLYQHFLTLVLLASAALLSTMLFYPPNPSRISVDLRNVIDPLSQEAVTISLIRNATENTPASTAKYVIVLTYQRCGSSFFGEIFNLNPKVFYAYEPLDSLYSALYGTASGWNVPSDITNMPDGTPRQVPQVEIDAVADFLRNLLTAQVDKLPTETLVHKFWTYFGNWHRVSWSFRLCLKKNDLMNVTCYSSTNDYCGRRFGLKPPERMEECRRRLANTTKATGRSRKTSKTSPVFDNYRSCFQSYRERVDANCTDLLRKAIADRHLRATKVVRATMESMGPLLRALPSLRIIHLVRDPRAVALSRSRFGPSGKGLYYQQVYRNKSGSRVLAEASLYCRHVIADIRSRLALEREFPGRIKLVRYEDVVDNPAERFREVYELLGEPVPEKTLKQMQSIASKGQKRNLTTKWQRSLKLSDQRAIARHCDEFFQLLGISSDDEVEVPLSATTPTPAPARRKRYRVTQRNPRDAQPRVRRTKQVVGRSV